MFVKAGSEISGNRTLKEPRRSGWLGTAGRLKIMRIMRFFGLATLLAAALTFVPSTAHAQVGVGIGIGPEVDYPAPVYVAGPPVCSWGYYGYYPYACAPYGFYGPDWFYGGFFIGAGPWFRGGFFGRPWGFGFGRIGFNGWRGGFGGFRGGVGGFRGGVGGFRGGVGGFRGGTAGGFRGGTAGGFRGGAAGGFRGGAAGGFRGGSVGGGGFHGGGGGGAHGGGGGGHR
jgi:hypothetical protein